MHVFFRFAYAHWFYYAVPVFIGALAFRYYYTKVCLYQFPLVDYVQKNISAVIAWPIFILHFLRLSALLLCLFLLGKPQIVDQKSKVTVEGIDIMMVLDISGSMACFDDLKDRRTRITIAKQEGVRFVQKRHNDAIGLVVFGRYALMRCPLTPDKYMLKNMIDSITMNNGDSIHEGTVISQAVITAARHLQKSKSASKIIILLTDGEPSAHDFSASEAIAIAKAFGIKVYTVGIGNHGLSMQEHPLFGVIQYQNNFDTHLLQALADQTGGKFFDAKKVQDVAKIYDEIDALEKTQYQDNVFMKYYDYFIPFIWLVIIFAFVELILSTFVWTIL